MNPLQPCQHFSLNLDIIGTLSIIYQKYDCQIPIELTTIKKNMSLYGIITDMTLLFCVLYLLVDRFQTSLKQTLVESCRWDYQRTECQSIWSVMVIFLPVMPIVGVLRRWLLYKFRRCRKQTIGDGLWNSKTVFITITASRVV